MTHAQLPVTTRGRRTRESLVRAARFVFERDGFASARITDIARRARVAVGSFYTYFDSKDAVFRAVIESVGAELAAPLPRVPGEDPGSRLRAGVAAYVRVYKQNARILAVLQHRVFEDEGAMALRQEGLRLFVDRAERAIRRLQAGGLAARETSPRFAAVALASMVHAYCYETFALAGETPDEAEVARGLSDLWLRALGAPIDSKRRSA